MTFAEPTVIAKSSILLDVKPWDDETDMGEMERLVRTVETDGLKWGACKYTAAAGLILGLRPANGRRRYFVTTSLIGWVQT